MPFSPLIVILALFLSIPYLSWGLSTSPLFSFGAYGGGGPSPDGSSSSSSGSKVNADSDCGPSRQSADAADSASIFARIVNDRYACTRFQRHDGVRDSVEVPSATSDQVLVDEALRCLDLARRAPSGFNVQPYKMVMVTSPKTKSEMARYCIGRNAHRVRDSDCTAVFLADRRAMRTLEKYRRLMWVQKAGNEPKNVNGPARQWINRLKVQFYIGLFSSGLPLPKFLAGPISFAVRYLVLCFVAPLSWLILRFPLPTLTSADTWSHKNTMLAAMTYMLACTSRSIATCPMEGYAARGIMKALRVPPGYTVPLIVATGRSYHHDPSLRGNMVQLLRPSDGAVQNVDNIDSYLVHNDSDGEPDDVGMHHGGPGAKYASPRHPREEMIFVDKFGNGWDGRLNGCY